mmetsp:Transcript_33293/g.34594  ORF Transcript_33293/g.34594 Transcript_33293/m.34594 type:complete len:266 (-) Transcript_33293:84-881(-)
MDNYLEFDENLELLISNYRKDGRLINELRNMEIKTSQVFNSSGSSLIHQGGTKILCWIKGPKEARNKNSEKLGSVRCDFTLSQSAYPYIKSDLKRDLQMREFSSTLKEIFEEVILLKHYPKSEIEISVVVLQNDGSYKTIAITAITLALINAGIYIKDTAVGVTVGLHQDKYLVDLTKEEERAKLPVINTCYLPNFKKFVFKELINAKLDYSKSEEMIKSVERFADDTYVNIKSFLLRSYKCANTEETNLSTNLLKEGEEENDNN